MSNYDLGSEALVAQGLERLHEEAFGSTGFALGMDEVVDIVIKRPSSTYRRGHMKSGTKVVQRERDAKYSREALSKWLDDCRMLAFVPGRGTWTTAEVHVFAESTGQLNLFDEEHLDRMPNGNWYPGAHPSGAGTWAQQLLAYPRTPDNIPSWMWDIFRAEGVTPPVYNPEFKSVDWKNRRRPVTERGTDFTVEPTVIDPSLEPGVFAKIGKKLFGG
ncbi:hypothetical protein ACIQC5_05300 [Paenarthrobacter sp. NPDC092416]|uniref:hypothetical protein n=1 Tax=Paenarthrobacter sp. NPDC092416 TaxID=3364386 RepID=UPI003821D0BE